MQISQRRTHFKDDVPRTLAMLERHSLLYSRKRMFNRSYFGSVKSIRRKCVNQIHKKNLFVKCTCLARAKNSRICHTRCINLCTWYSVAAFVQIIFTQYELRLQSGRKQNDVVIRGNTFEDRLFQLRQMYANKTAVLNCAGLLYCCRYTSNLRAWQHTEIAYLGNLLHSISLDGTQERALNTHLGS